jgi:Sulfocyanin (SoxE) domain
VRGTLFLTALITLLVLAGFTASASAASPRASHWLSWSSPKKTATLDLVAGLNDMNNGFNFDGYGRGKLLVRMPLGWRLTVICRNAASTRHSCAVVPGLETNEPAFRGATIASPIVGLLSGQSARFTFTAMRAGVYRITSLVPGDEQARMWDVLEVGGVERPSISTRTGF